MKKLLFIYNTHAGKGLLKSRLAAVLEALTLDWDVTVHPTRGAGDAAELAARRAGPPAPPPSLRSAPTTCGCGSLNGRRAPWPPWTGWSTR